MALDLLHPTIRPHHRPQIRRRPVDFVHPSRLVVRYLRSGEYHGVAFKSNGYVLLQALHSLWMHITFAGYLPGCQWSRFVLVHVSIASPFPPPTSRV